MRGVEGPLLVVRPAGIEDARADLRPVQAELVVAQPGDEDHGQRGPVLEREFPSQVDAAGLGIVGPRVAEQDGPLGPELPDLPGPDPLGLPVPRIEEAGHEHGRLAPRARNAFAVPPADLPEITGAARERFPAVFEGGQGRGVDPAGVPEIADVVPEELGRGRNERPGALSGSRPGRGFRGATRGEARPCPRRAARRDTRSGGGRAGGQSWEPPIGPYWAWARK